MSIQPVKRAVLGRREEQQEKKATTTKSSQCLSYKEQYGGEKGGGGVQSHKQLEGLGGVLWAYKTGLK